MFKVSFKTLFMRQNCALQITQLSSRPNIGKQYDVGGIFCAMPQGGDKTIFPVLPQDM